MICSRCGAHAEGRFCSSCGDPVQDASSQGVQLATRPIPNAGPYNLPPQQVVHQVPAPAYREEKSKVVAGLLAIFLGGLGIHKFYLGQTGQGVAFLVSSIISGFLWIVVIGFLGTIIICTIALIQGIGYLVMSDGSFQAKYGQPAYAGRP